MKQVLKKKEEQEIKTCTTSTALSKIDKNWAPGKFTRCGNDLARLV